jgi:hypothetical protein
MAIARCAILSSTGEVLFLLHNAIDFEWMREAYWLTRKDGATGIDGMTAQEYEADLEANLKDLRERIISGRYKAPPVRRAYIPKADGSQRPAFPSPVRLSNAVSLTGLQGSSPLPVCPANGSLHAAPPFPPAGSR